MSEIARNIRIVFFIIIFVSMSSWEIKFPRRVTAISKLMRWKTNLSLAGINLLMERLISPLGATGFALLAEKHGLGFFNLTDINTLSAFLLSILLLDLTVYFQHVLFHKLPVLARIHSVHHTDMELDITSGIRFHPMEILFSLLLKALVIMILGCSPASVLAFEVILNGASLFNHSNIYIPPKLDSLMRLIIVTPDMHRIHHSILKRERNSNYGFSFSWWDRLFRNYTQSPLKGQAGMTLGLSQFRQNGETQLLFLLKLPFGKK